MKIIVTGGAGFIGSALVRYLTQQKACEVVNLDLLTYAGNLRSLHNVDETNAYQFVQVDICDAEAVQGVIDQIQPDGIIHLAAESHVDRSIDGSAQFMATNILGTHSLLEASRLYWETLEGTQRDQFKFLHISTDEVYGDLSNPTELFTEEHRYQPSSPYAASKASSDHLVRAWHRTYGLPTLITNCSNNYGPFQFPEKLIPHMIITALSAGPLPVYGDGQQIRDWLYVDDHVRALWQVFNSGEIGQTYNVGGHNEVANIDVVHTICDLVAELTDSSQDLRSLITYVKDRPGHDRRYAIDATKIDNTLGWRPEENFQSGLRKTVAWYVENEWWWREILDGSYRLNRIGLGDDE